MAATDQQKKAYQTVIAGRVREDELLAFYGGNYSAFAPGIFNANRTGGSVVQPVLYKEHLKTEYVGKIRSSTGDAIVEAYDQGSNNNGTR